MLPDQLSDGSSEAGTFPRRLGRYVLVCHLGEGGMGRVYLALSRTGVQGKAKEELVVVKRFGNPRSHFTPQQIDENKQRFRREAQITLALSHPCIARTFVSVEQDSRSYLVQEFVHGMTLEYLNLSMVGNGEQFPVRIAAHVVAEIARALDYLHDFRGLGLIHRDVTPSNVMLSERGEVKVIDFGIAKATRIADGVTKPHVLIGKPVWTAPEVMEGRQPDRRSDLYSLGLLFWSLLTGRTPESQPGAPVRVVGPSTFNLDVPSPLNDVVVTAIRRDPDRRFQTARALLEALAPFLPARGQGSNALAGLVVRFQPALERRFLAEVVSRGRPLLDEPRAQRRRKLGALLLLPLAGALGLGVRLHQSRPAVELDVPKVATKAAPNTAVSSAATAAAQPVPALPASTIVPTSTIPPTPAVPVPVGMIPGQALPEHRHARPPDHATRRPHARGKLVAPTEAPPTSADDMLDAAMEALSGGDSVRAVVLARASARAHPSPEAYILIGRILFDTDPTAAAAAFETAGRISPGDREAARLRDIVKARLARDEAVE